MEFKHSTVLQLHEWQYRPVGLTYICSGFFLMQWRLTATKYSTNTYVWIYIHCTMMHHISLGQQLHMYVRMYVHAVKVGVHVSINVDSSRLPLVLLCPTKTHAHLQN